MGKWRQAGLGLLLVAACLPGSSVAQGEHSRRAAAEIRVILGDVIRLQTETLSPQHQSGLQDRIAGGLASLDILLALADQEMQRPYTSYRPLILSIAGQNADKLDNVRTTLAELAKTHPLIIPQNINTLATSRLTSIESLHKQHCSACHDIPVQQTERPAHNLYDSASAMSGDEFFARMLVGVRGDRVTGIDNPLSDLEIMGLIWLYTSGTPE